MLASKNRAQEGPFFSWFSYQQPRACINTHIHKMVKSKCTHQHHFKKNNIDQ
jgi:hypothetical protein